MKMILITAAVMLLSTSVFAVETTPINLKEVADAKRLEIIVDTSEKQSGQSMMIKVYTESKSEPVIAMFDVTTGRAERRTPPYRGGVISLEKKRNIRYAILSNAFILENRMVIRQIKRTSQSSAADMLRACIQRNEACSSGSIAMLEHDSNALFALAKLVGKENIKVVVGSGIMSQAIGELKN